MAGKFDKVIRQQGLGSGLLSESSRQFAVNEFKVTYISLQDLIPNQQNQGFSMEDIDELKTSIREVGLEQNLVVVPDGSKFRILTGHRRYLALCQLYEEGLEKFKTVPCIVKDLRKIELPLSERSKELYAIATTNLENRRYTDADKLKMMEMLSQVYDELRQNGYEKLGKRRDFLAERLGISSAGVQILKFVDKNLDEVFRDAFAREKLPLMVANEIAHMSPAQQQAYHQYLKEHHIQNFGVKDVQHYASTACRTAAPEAAPEPRKSRIGTYEQTRDQFSRFIADFEECDEFTVGDAIKLNRLQLEIAQRIEAASRIVQKYRSRPAGKKS